MRFSIISSCEITVRKVKFGTYLDLPLFDHDLFFEFVRGHAARQLAITWSFYYLVEVEGAKAKVM